MRRSLLLAPLALLVVPFATAPASADSVTIRSHSGYEAPAYGSRKVVKVRREVGTTGSTRRVKKVTRTNEFGDRVTKKTIRDSDD